MTIHSFKEFSFKEGDKIRIDGVDVLVVLSDNNSVLLRPIAADGHVNTYAGSAFGLERIKPDPALCDISEAGLLAWVDEAKGKIGRLVFEESMLIKTFDSVRFGLIHYWETDGRVPFYRTSI